MIPQKQKIPSELTGNMPTTTIIEISSDEEVEHVVELPGALHYAQRTDLGAAVLDVAARVRRDGDRDECLIDTYNDLLSFVDVDYRIPKNTELFFFGQNHATERAFNLIEQKYSRSIAAQAASVYDQMLIEGRDMVDDINRIYAWYNPWNDAAHDRAKAKAFNLEQFVNADREKPGFFSDDAYKKFYARWLSDLYDAIIQLEKAQTSAPFFEMPDRLKSDYLRYRAWVCNWHIHERVCELLGCYPEAYGRMEESPIGADEHYWLYSSVSLCTPDKFVDSDRYMNFYYSKRV